MELHGPFGNNPRIGQLAKHVCKYLINLIDRQFTIDQLRKQDFIVLAMGLKPSPSGETFRFFVC